MMTDSILEILLKAQKYVESLGGRFSARIVVWPAQIVSFNVDYEKVPGVRSGGFGAGTRGDLDELRKDLERFLDSTFGPKWREAKSTTSSSHGGIRRKRSG